MAQQNNQRGGQQVQHQQQPSQNEQISADEKLKGVLGELERRGEEIASVLPRDMSLDAFLATANQALRKHPKLLRCTGPSLVNACVQAAYDGLRIDGKEAAIVDAKERYQDGSGVWRERIVARYMPMVLGFIKQILEGGLVQAVQARVVYRNDEFQILEGTTPGLVHKPLVEGERGAMIGAYSRATLPSGLMVFEWMRKDEIEDVQKEAKSKNVWERWPGEMWKKTVIRRHRKTLPGTSHIRDEEAREMFGMGHNSMASYSQLSGPMPSRPTREAPRLTAGDQPLPMDLGNRGDDREMQEGEREQQQDRQQDQRQKEAPREEAKKSDMPHGDREWIVWGSETEAAIAKSARMHDLSELNLAVADTLKAAPKGIRDRIAGQFSDRAAVLAAGPDDGAAADDSGDDTAAGDQS